MADITLPFGIQSEYDLAIMRTGTTPQLDVAVTRISELVAMGSHKAEKYMWAFYRVFDGGPITADNQDGTDETEEIEYHGE
jgi:hypothetical protein